jgi:hypothetical protein
MHTRSAAIGSLMGLVAMSMTVPAHGFAHLWVVKEVFSNYDGSVQFIELFTTGPGETFLQGTFLTAKSDDDTQSVSPTNLSEGTFNKHLLFATPGFSSLSGGITPNFTIPAKFFDPDAASIEIDWGVYDGITFTGSALPKNGVHSFTDSNLVSGGGQTLTIGVNSPTNFGGAVGSVNVPVPGDADLDGKVDVNDLGTLASNWQTSGTRSQGDFDGDGFIGVNDLGLLATNWQVGVTAAAGAAPLAQALADLGLPAAAVPEPAGASALLGAPFVLARRRRAAAGNTHRSRNR